jgi:hypothetical protein
MEYPNIATIAAIMSFTSAGLSRDSSGQPEPDTDLNDTENVSLKENVQTYFAREVTPHVPDAWIDPTTDRILTMIGGLTK